MSRKLRVDPAHCEKQAASPRLDAVGITALAKASKADKQRDLLKPGMHDVDLAVSGTIDGEGWSRTIHGSLVIAPDSAPVASSSTPWDGLLMSALWPMSAKTRQEWLAVVADGHIPGDISANPLKADAIQAEMEAALSGFRAKHPTAKRGTVSFVQT